MHPTFEIGLGPHLILDAWVVFALLAFWSSLGWLIVSLGYSQVTPRQVVLFVTPFVPAWFLGAFVGQDWTVGYRNWNLLLDGKLNFSGMVLYGGMIACVLAARLSWSLQSWRKRVSSETLFDLGMISLGLLIFFGRIGCFLSGCCYGAPAGDWPGVIIPAARELALRSVPLHPAPLYESLLTGLFTALAAGVTLREKQVRSRSAVLQWFQTPGWKGWIVLGGYALTRFALEFIRADERGAGSWGLSPSQWISLFFLIAMPFELLRHYRRHQRETKTTGTSQSV